MNRVFKPRTVAFAKAVGWVIFLIVGIGYLKHIVEETDSGKRFLLLSQEFLQRAVSDFDAHDRLKVLVIDVSKIPGGTKGAVTPRRPVIELIDAIAYYRPALIAVDIDLSPGEAGLLSSEDYALLQYLKSKDEVVPIVLGISRARDAGPDAWLGHREFAPLAADAVADAERGRVVSRINVTHKGVEDTELPRMGFAIATRYVSQTRGARWPIAPAMVAGALEPGAEEAAAALARHEPAEQPHGGLLINFSKLNQLRHETLATITPASVEEFGPYFAGRIVILGDVRDRGPDDNFIPPGADMTPGVYLHAAAAYTMLFEPLYEFKWWMRLMLDAVFSLPLLILVVWTQLSKSNPTHADDERTARIQLWICIGGAIAILLIGWAIMGLMRIIWIDFLMVAIALLLHPVFERLWELVREAIRPSKSAEH